MTQIIKDKSIIENEWTTVADDAAIPAGKVIVSLDRWNEEQEALSAKRDAGELGIQLRSEQTADLIADQANDFALIAVEFPKFADGRGYSAARLLRERFGFKGELRAVGDVLHDQLFFMDRCGFNSMDMRKDQDLALAEQAFKTFSEPYQAGVSDPRPLYRRR
jgi:uncharacterized protein (DUF934 family)